MLTVEGLYDALMELAKRVRVLEERLAKVPYNTQGYIWDNGTMLTQEEADELDSKKAQKAQK